MLFSALKHSRGPDWPVVSAFFRRRFLRPRHIAMLFALYVTNLLYTEIFLVRYGWGHGIMGTAVAFTLLYSVDLFAIGLVIVTADVFDEARRNGLFQDLELAGMSGTLVMAALFDIVAALIAADGIAGNIIRTVISNEPFAVKLYGFILTCVFIVPMVYGSGGLIILMNLRRWSVPAQVAALTALNFALLGIIQLVGSTLSLQLAGWLRSGRHDWLMAPFEYWHPTSHLAAASAIGIYVAVSLAGAILFVSGLIFELCCKRWETSIARPDI